jgi:hypothetical protein
MAIMMMVEQGDVFFQCDECDQSFFDNNEVMYGHDCEVSNETI